MEQEIILEGIHAMLEEIRDNMKRNPEQEMINSKLVAIEIVCNELAERKLATEDLVAGFISYVLKQMIEMDKKQDEKIEKLREYILGHHKFVKEQMIRRQQNVDVRLERIENLLKKRQQRQSIFFRLLNKI